VQREVILLRVLFAHNLHNVPKDLYNVILVDDGVGHDARTRLERLADSGEVGDLPLRTAVLLVNLHHVKQALDGEQRCSGEAHHTRVGEGDREIVRLETACKAGNRDLALLARDLGLEQDTDADTFAVQHVRASIAWPMGWPKLTRLHRLVVSRSSWVTTWALTEIE
jgi:hypothetical protein